MNQTINYGLKFLNINQNGKELTINHNMIIIDFLHSRLIKSFIKNLPENPENGDNFIIKDDKKSTNNHIAIFYEGWSFIKPTNFFTAFISNEPYQFKNNNWEKIEK
ncbi:MAG: hypothetical protein J0H68_07965 [Sphingobacteriia bacterium]|nr:hypothetical protein [Sphingobacteriia bacterium]